ncbi:hypothetical protein KHS38_22135, partial [Mucilaginibacter sp. Bleaf8]|uniref:TaqI-like C-terminal specificity domain-containing protein n=1 Tax=Mucilaginibacter sp. Bleaf8 TaxID=2834430 RepID=UPI001BCAC38C
DDFNRQKIVWGEISDRTKFCIDLNGEFVVEATAFILTGDSLIYLLGFLNSKFSQYLFSKIGTTTGVGTVRWKKFTIEQLYVPKHPKYSLEVYESIILQVINSIQTKTDCSALLKTIDEMIYEEFDLTSEEIQFIDYQ